MSVIELHAACRDSGVRLTTKRAFIYESLASYPGGFSISDLVERVRQVDPAISRSTVYRALLLFRQMGLLFEAREGAGKTYYRVTKNEDVQGSHLLCSYCNRAIEFSDERLDRMLIEVANRAGFALAHHEIIGFGLCKSCRRTGGVQ